MKEFFYKYGLVIFLIITISILAYQKEANKVSDVIPSEALVITINTPIGPLPAILEKGLLNKSNEGKKWITLKDFKERMSNRGCKPKIDNKHTFEAREKEKSNAVYKKRG